MTFIVLIWTLLLYVIQSSGIPQQYQSPSTFRATTFHFIPSVSTGVVSENMNFYYSSSLPQNSSSYRKALIGVSNINMELDPSYRIYWKITYVSNGWGAVSADWNFLNASLLHNFVIRHMIVDAVYTGLFQTVYKSISGTYTGPTSYTYLPLYGATIDMTKNNRVLVFLTGIDINCNTSNVKFSLVGQVFNSTYAKLVVNTKAGSIINFYSVTLTVFNVQDFQTANITISYGLLESSNGHMSIPQVNSNFLTSFMAGVRSFEFDYTSIIFDSDLTSSGFSTSGTSMLQLSFHYFYAGTYQCPLSNPYFFESLCYDVCPDRYYQKNNPNTCLACQVQCFTCNNNSTCSGCSPNDYRSYSSGSCIPDPGYYQNGQRVAGQCSSPCLQCQASATNCLSCIDNRYLYDGLNFLCLKCNSSYGFCQTCDTSNCLTCSFGYQLDANSTCVIIPCDIIGVLEGCSSCEFGYSDVCASCDPTQGFQFVSSTKLCKPICGDGIFITGYDQQCDDGNLDSMDGCSPTCTIQDNFQCDAIILPNLSLTSDCTYLLPIEIAINTYQRIMNTNKIQFSLSLYPLLKVFKNFDFSQIISTDIPVSQYTFSYDQTTGNLKMIISYTQTIQNTTGMIFINPLTTGVFRLTPSSNTSSLMQSSTFLPLNYYHDQYYMFGQIVFFLGAIVSVVAWIAFILGYYTGQIIGIETLGIVQVSYLALFALSQTPTNPCILALSSLGFSNGINIYYLMNQDPYSVNILPEVYKELNFYPAFLQNFNLMFLLFIFALISALIVFIKIKTNKQMDQIENLMYWQKKTLFDYSFSSILVLQYIIILSSVIQLKYGIFNLQNEIDYISLAFLVICLIPLIAYFILFYLRPKDFNQYKKFVSVYVVHAQKFFLFIMIQRLIIGVIISSIQLGYGLIVAGILFVIEILIISIKRPYARFSDNIRCISNSIVEIVILGAVAYLSFLSTQSYQKQAITFFIPIIIIVLILIAVIYNLIFLITYIKWSREQQLQKKEIQMEIGDLNKLRMQAYQMTECTPSPFMFVKQAIEKQKQKTKLLLMSQICNANQKNNAMDDEFIKTVVDDQENKMKIQLQDDQKGNIKKFQKDLSRSHSKSSVRSKLLDKDNDNSKYNQAKQKTFRELKKLKQEMAVEMTTQQVYQQWDAFTKNYQYQKQKQNQFQDQGQGKKSSDKIVQEQKQEKKQSYKEKQNEKEKQKQRQQYKQKEKQKKNTEQEQNFSQQKQKKSNKKNAEQTLKQQQQIIDPPKVNFFDFDNL